MPAPLTHPGAYSESEREKGLMVLARHGGNSRKAAAELAEYFQSQGRDTSPSHTTLVEWRDRFPERYQQIREQIAPEIEREAITTYREIVIRGAQGQLQATEQAITDLETGNVKDASTSARNLAIATGVAADKLLLFTNRPTQRVEHTDVDTLLGKLTRALGSPTIDSTAEEIAPEHQRSLTSSGD